MSDLIERLNAGIAVCDRRLLTLRTQQDIELALVFREILTETRDEIERLGRELAEARDGIKEVMSDHADTLDRLAEAERDAARYRFARLMASYRPENGGEVVLDALPWPNATLPQTADYFDAAIDAAMASEAVGDGRA